MAELPDLYLLFIVPCSWVPSKDFLGCGMRRADEAMRWVWFSKGSWGKETKEGEVAKLAGARARARARRRDGDGGMMGMMGCERAVFFCAKGAGQVPQIFRVASTSSQFFDLLSPATCACFALRMRQEREKR